jgi:spoIIIJ-associated protein
VSEPARAEGVGETVGEARWQALRALRADRPDLEEHDVEFEVVSEGLRTMLGRVSEPARVVATVREGHGGGAAGPAAEGPGAEGPGADALASCLEAVVEGMGLEASVDVREGPEGSLVGSIQGPGAGRVVGRGGQVIDAVQYIAAHMVSRAEGGGRRRVTVDADGYRARRVGELERLAARAAAEALRDGDEIELDPMSPQDRRIVHMALAENPGVVTRSEGDEPRRRVIVEPAE